MKRKDYEKPTMKVVQLQQQSHILTGSVQSKSAGVQDYNVQDEQEW